MENEKAEQERLEIQGRYNLQMGIHLAQQDLMEEMEAVASDDSLPDLTPEQLAQLNRAVSAKRRELNVKRHRAALGKKMAMWGGAAAAGLVLIPTVAMSVGATRTAISNYVIHNFDKYSVIQYDNENNAIAPIGWRSKYYPRWLPDGFEIESVEFTEWGDYIWYSSSSDQKLSFFVTTNNSRPQINSEYCNQQEAQIGEHRAILCEKTDKRATLLFIPFEDGAIQIEGNISSEIACEIANSIAF